MGILRSSLFGFMIFAFGFLTTATAAEAPAKGWYIGGAAGVSKLDDDGLFDGLDFDDSDTALTLFGGYKILKYLAIEGRYSDFGTFSVSDSIDTVNIDASALTVQAVGIIPFGTSGWELYGQAGWGQASFDIKCSGCPSEDETAIALGVGVRWYATSHFAISLQTDRYFWDVDDSDNVDVGDVSVGGTQVGVQYSF